jgi:putative spermidine/putrescine transport system ATP-binding protein
MSAEALLDTAHTRSMASATSTELRVDALCKSYGGSLALNHLTLHVAPGTFQAILGPSGSGKTSLLMCVAGFMTPDSGKLLVNGRDVLPLPPEKRNFGMVFQGYALFPHLTVLDNVAFGLRARGLAKDEQVKLARSAIQSVRLQGMEGRYPRQLSGGQQQRVALARAIAFKPDLLLLDEPLSALDRALRSDLQIELKELQRRTGLTCLYVTHDQDEALSMADVVAVMSAGQIRQIGSPTELYERPNSRFVASFLGKSNFIELDIVTRDGEVIVGRRGDCVISHIGAIPPGAFALLTLRPEKITLSILGQPREQNRNYIEAVVLHASYLGNAAEIVAQSASFGEITVRAPASSIELAVPGRTVELSWSMDSTVAVPSES